MNSGRVKEAIKQWQNVPYRTCGGRDYVIEFLEKEIERVGKRLPALKAQAANDILIKDLESIKVAALAAVNVLKGLVE